MRRDERGTDCPCGPVVGWTRLDKAIMHFNFDFTTAQVLWTLTFAALLVLLVVLLGRDRVRLFPWFTASIALVTLRMLIGRLLYGRIAPTQMSTVFILLGVLGSLIGLLVLVEVARRAFGGLQRSLWIVNTVGMVTVACGVLAAWGPWPVWKTLTADSQLATLRLIELVAQKGNLLAELLAVELGLVMAIFGRRFKAGWRSQSQQIAIGLSTAAISELIVLGAWQLIATRTTPHSQADVNRLVDLGARLVNGNKVVYLAVLVWWIVWFWMDEPGAGGVGEVLIVDAIPVEADADIAEHVEGGEQSAAE